jgi:hypothetical protein
MQINGKSLLVFGSRTLDDKRIEDEIAAFIEGTDYKFIITALDPGGVCERVKHFCKASRLGIVLIQVGLDEKRGRGMHEARSAKALEMADHMLAIWDGESKGTKNEIELAKKMKVPTTVIKLQPAPKPSVNLEEFGIELPDFEQMMKNL